MDAQSEKTPKFFDSKNLKFIVLFLVVCIIFLFLLIASQLSKNKQSVVTQPGPVKKSLQLAGMDLVLQGSIIAKNDKSLVVTEGEGDALAPKTTIYVDPQTIVVSQTLSRLPQKSTSSGVLASVLKSSKQASYQDIQVGDTVTVVLDERSDRLFARNITIIAAGKQK